MSLLWWCFSYLSTLYKIYIFRYFANLNKHIFLGISHKILGMSNSFFQNSRYADIFFRYQIRPKIPYCDMSGRTADCRGYLGTGVVQIVYVRNIASCHVLED